MNAPIKLNPYHAPFNSKMFLPLFAQLAVRFDIDPVSEGARILELDISSDEAPNLSVSTQQFLKRVVQHAVRCVYQHADRLDAASVARESGLEFLRTVHAVLNGSVAVGMSESTIVRDMANAANHEVRFEIEHATDETTEIVKAIALIVGLTVVNQIAVIGDQS